MRKKRNNVTKEQKEKIIEIYNNSTLTIRDLAKQFNYEESACYRLLRKNNCIIRQSPKLFPKIHSVNENYFNTIDAEDKAYFLGLMYSDGWNQVQRNCIGIRLSGPDKEILEKFKKHLEYTGPLNFTKAQKTTHQDQHGFQIYNEKLSQDLIKLGCGPHKSLIIEFPSEKQIPKSLIQHFIRGVFDGDGSIFCITVDGRPYEGISIAGSKSFCQSLDLFLKQLQIKSRWHDKGKIGELRICDRKSFYQFMEWLYKNSTIWMKRKRDRYLEIEKCCEEFRRQNPPKTRAK